MKKIQICLIAVTLLFTHSCVPGDDFEVPKAPEPGEVVLETNVSISSLLGAFYQSSEEGEVYMIEEDLVMEAYVVSSDETGNFYKELILQEAPEDPRAGIAVQLNLTSYYATFDFGRKIFVKLKGLSVGELNGVAALGIGNGKLIDPIPLSQIQEYLVRSADTATIVPLKLRVLDFNDRMENLYVELEQVQFSSFYVSGEKAFTFASEENDEFDGERELVSCRGDFPVVLSTSTFADFKTLELPKGSGMLR